MARQITWMRKERPAVHVTALPGLLDVSKGTYDLHFEDLGIIQVVGEPLYDNGVYFIVDTVKDLQFDILSDRDDGPGYFLARRVNLDKYEAIRIADEMKDADERANA